MLTKIHKRKLMSEETKRKISLATKGRIFSREHIRNLSESHMGQVAWNKGLKGQIPWNKGKTYRGKPCSEETKEKIRKANTGYHHTEEARRKMSESRRKENLSKETIKRMSEAQKGKHLSEKAKMHLRECNSGDKGSNWQGGKSFEPYTIQFNRELKELIRQRDNYQCQLCGMSECENIQKLCIHHIDYIKKNCLPSNLISLCRSCHSKTYSKREYWIEYFTKEGV